MPAHTVTIESTQQALNQHVITFAPTVRQAFRVGLEFETLPEIGLATADHTYTAQNVAIGDLIQPYQPRFTPKNTETWDAVDNVIRPFKIDLAFNEEQLVKFFEKWRNEWYEAGKDPLVWTYPRYITDNLLAPKWQEEMNTLAWSGEFAEPTPGTAGDFLESVDGYDIRIQNAITDGKLVPVPSGSFTSSNIRQKVEDWMKSLPEGVRGRKGVLLMSDTNARNYYYDYRGEFATATWASLQQNGGLKVDGFDVQIKGLMAMEGSNRWIFLPAKDNNMIVVNRRGYAMYPTFTFDHDLYNLYMKAVMYRAYGFEYWDTLYVNDQA